MVDLLIFSLLAQTQTQIEVRVRRPPGTDIDAALVEMDDGDQEPIVRRTRDGYARFTGRCTRYVKFVARMPHPRPPHIPNPSARVTCSRSPVELWLYPPSR